MPSLKQSQLGEKSVLVILSAFFNIMNDWHVKAEDQRTLLGHPAKLEFYNWKNGNISNLSNDTLERVSYILGIYTALKRLFPTREQANAWPLKPNKEFNYESALEIMLKGSSTQLRDIRRYLEAQLG